MRKGRVILVAVAAVVVLAAVAGGVTYLLMPHPQVAVTQTGAPNPDTSAKTVAATTTPVAAQPVAASAASTPVASAGAVAMTGTKSQHGDWQLSCDTPPGASFEQCAIIQNVTAEDQPNVGLSVIVLKTADAKARLLRVLAPRSAFCCQTGLASTSTAPTWAASPSSGVCPMVASPRS